MRARVLLRRLEYVLWSAGALALGFCAGLYMDAHFFQAQQNRRLEEALREQRPSVPGPVPRQQRPIGSLVGRIEIPRLGFSAVVLEGSDSGTLRVGVGRIPETADPGQKGNVVLAGHRDTFFRPLRGIHNGDRIEVTTPSGHFQYAVDWTAVVNPTDISVLKSTPQPALTLVTCYPFYYIGPAPKRFIVRARQLGSGPAAASDIAETREAAPQGLPPGKPNRSGTKVAGYRHRNANSFQWR